MRTNKIKYIIMTYSFTIFQSRNTT